MEYLKSDLVTTKARKKETELSDHIQFLITEKSPPQACSVDVVREIIDEGDILSEGKTTNFIYKLEKRILHRILLFYFNF